MIWIWVAPVEGIRKLQIQYTKQQVKKEYHKWHMVYQRLCWLLQMQEPLLNSALNIFNDQVSGIKHYNEAAAIDLWASRVVVCGHLWQPDIDIGIFLSKIVSLLNNIPIILMAGCMLDHGPLSSQVIIRNCKKMALATLLLLFLTIHNFYAAILAWISAKLQNNQLTLVKKTPPKCIHETFINS